MSRMETNETRTRQHEHHARQYAAYHDDCHAEINQARRLVKHLSHNPTDACARAALRALPMSVLRQVRFAVECAQEEVGQA
jgi:ribosomal protein S15P/S13E